MVDPLRGERILSFLDAAGLLSAKALHTAELASFRHLRRVHDDERGLGVLEQRVGLVGALPEAAEHRVEGSHERLNVLQQLATEHLGQGVGDDVHPDAEHLEAGPASRLGRCRQEPDEAAVEERAQALGGVEEVQRRPRRGGVHDDEVPAAVPTGFGAQLTELLHRHVLLGAGERARQRLVEGVGEDLLGLLRGGVVEDDLVEGPLHVEHHRVEGAAPSRVDPEDGAGGVVELREPE